MWKREEERCAGGALKLRGARLRRRRRSPGLRGVDDLEVAARRWDEGSYLLAGGIHKRRSAVRARADSLSLFLSLSLSISRVVSVRGWKKGESRASVVLGEEGGEEGNEGCFGRTRRSCASTASKGILRLRVAVSLLETFEPSLLGVSLFVVRERRKLGLSLSYTLGKRKRETRVVLARRRRWQSEGWSKSKRQAAEEAFWTQGATTVPNFADSRARSSASASR